MRQLFFAFSTCCLLLTFACTADELPMPVAADCNGSTPTYSIEIRPIIDQNCAYSGCHLDAEDNYSSYNGLLPSLEAGVFRRKVLDLRSDETLGMPPVFAPADRSRDLTETELLLIECWLDAGFPE